MIPRNQERSASFLQIEQNKNKTHMKQHETPHFLMSFSFTKLRLVEVFFLERAGRCRSCCFFISMPGGRLDPCPLLLVASHLMRCDEAFRRTMLEMILRYLEFFRHFFTQDEKKPQGPRDKNCSSRFLYRTYILHPKPAANGEDEHSYH